MKTKQLQFADFQSRQEGKLPDIKTTLSHRPFTRIISKGKVFKTLIDYVKNNILQSVDGDLKFLTYCLPMASVANQAAHPKTFRLTIFKLQKHRANAHINKLNF